MTARSVPVSVFVSVTGAPGSTPPELSETVPSMAPLAACDCANAGAPSVSDSSAERNILSMFASIQRETQAILRLAVESDDLVSRIHFFEVIPEQNATGEVRAGERMACVAEREEVMGVVPVRADRRQGVDGQGVVGCPAVLRLQPGDIGIERRQLVHQLAGALNHDFVP